jgi:hypothetical protein
MHTASITADELVKMLHWQFFHSLSVTLGISLIKISVAFFLLRLVPGKAYKWFLYGMIGMLRVLLGDDTSLPHRICLKMQSWRWICSLLDSIHPI